MCYPFAMIKDTQITELLGIPRNTMQNMKNSDSSNWRFKVYSFLKNQDIENLKIELTKNETLTKDLNPPDNGSAISKAEKL